MKKNHLPNAPILITLSEIMPNEAETLALLLRETVSLIHIRKPEASRTQLEVLLQQLSAQNADMSRFTLHYDEPLARQYGLGGVHLRYNDLTSGAGEGLRRSCSTHRWEEAKSYAAVADYVFLSPLFDSISKPGYQSSFTLAQAQAELRPHTGRIVALGGISSKHIVQVRQAGFDGVALLGAVWVTTSGNLDAERTLLNCRILHRKWRAAGGTLQFISDGNLTVAKQFLEGGGRWIQLRMKETPHETIIRQGRVLLALCRSYDATLIINDIPQLATAIGADGIHLGQRDMSPREARRIVGEGAIIGSTANTFEQIVACDDGYTDYIGLGPFRFTTTKKNLAPTLGTAGYHQMLGQMLEAGIHLPVVAIGGIESADVVEIMQTGLLGIALSGAIAHAHNPAAQTTCFLQEIESGRSSAIQAG